MIRPFLVGAALSVALVAPAFAVTQPHEGKADGRIRYVNYEPDNVVEIWSAPGAVLVIQFADDETVVNVAATDSHTLISFPRSNFLFWKFKGCLIPQPVIVLTKLSSGLLRRYDFQVETRPQLCPAPGVPTATIDDPPNTAAPDLKYISTDALAAGANVSYSVIFQYPHDAWLKKHAAELAARERANKEEAETLLRTEAERSTDPYTGQRNYRYLARGDTGLRPSQVWDNGYSTAFVFPGMQRMPSLFRINPDGKEAAPTYSVHGNTIIAAGTAQQWRLRDGQTVMEFYDLSYDPVGQTPGTGTVSPWVTRTIKGADNGR